MKPARVLYHLVRADFLERVRRTSFLLTLGFAIYLGYLAFSGTIVMSLGDYRGIYNSAWIGALMGVVASCFLTLVGFYIVKNSVLRDEQTRVGRILATTPMTKTFYTLGKTISNFAVLAAMVLVMGLASIALQLSRAEDSRIHLWQLLSPLLLLAMPALAFAAALAVLFESIPGLRGGAGNVAYFFLWTALLSGFGQVGVLDKGTPATSLQYFADYSGIVGEMTAMQRQVRAIDPAYKNSASLNIGQAPPAKRFVLRDQPWTPAFVLSRLFWLVAALLTSLLATVFFHRFDPAREGSRALRRAAPAETAVRDEVALSAPKKDVAQLTPLSRTKSASAMPRLVLSELRLMLQGQKWWWYTVAAGLWLGQSLSPRDAAVACLTVAWLWPLLLWSAMGARETRYFTGSLIFSAPRSLARQMPA
ncbi:MAG: hypothetical protein H0X25_02860, partial [Acidobacteriales bacterium]|nr:hypothetical protein [Terriglobales bacterium]